MVYNLRLAMHCKFFYSRLNRTESRCVRLAYRSGVTVGITSPSTRGFLSGLGTAFGTGLPHSLSKGAVLQEETALHFEILSSTPSISTHIAALRNLFSGAVKGELGVQAKKILEVKQLFLDPIGPFSLLTRQGDLPLVIRVQSADIMATLITLKKEIEAEHESQIQVTFVGANEAHLLAKEIGEAAIGVILAPSRPFPATWRSKRM